MTTNSPKKSQSAHARVVLLLAFAATTACSSNFDQFGGAGGHVTSTLDFGSAGSNATSGSGGGGRSPFGTGGSGGARAGAAGLGGAVDGGYADVTSDTGAGGGASPSGPHPTGITISPIPTSTSQQAPSPSGGPFIESCGSNEVIIGYTGTVDAPDASINFLRSFQAVCGSLSITGTTAFTVTTSMTQTLLARGMPSPVPQTRLCGANQVVVGFGGRSGGYIDQLTFACAPLIISGAAPAFTLSIGQAEMTPVGLGGPGGSAFVPILCPAGQVAVGDAGRSGGAIDAFGLLCATPSLVVQ